MTSMETSNQPRPEERGFGPGDQMIWTVLQLLALLVLAALFLWVDRGESGVK